MINEMCDRCKVEKSTNSTGKYDYCEKCFDELMKEYDEEHLEIIKEKLKNDKM